MNAEDRFRFRTGWDEISKKMAFRRLKEVFQDYKDYYLRKRLGYSFSKVNKCIFDPENLEMYYELLWNFRSSSDDDERSFGEEMTHQLPSICGVLYRRSKAGFQRLYRRPLSNQPEEEKRSNQNNFFEIFQKLSYCDQFELAGVLVADMRESKAEFKTVTEKYGVIRPRQIELISVGKVPETEYLPNFFASVVAGIKSPHLRLAILNCDQLPPEIKDGLKADLDWTSL